MQLLFVGVLGCIFVNDTATAEIYTLSLRAALPIFSLHALACVRNGTRALEGNEVARAFPVLRSEHLGVAATADRLRSEEHTSELQSRQYLVCRLLLEKTNRNTLTRSTRPLTTLHYT